MIDNDSNIKDLEMLTSDQVMKLLKISQPTLYRYVKKGALKSYKFGRDLKFKRKDVAAFIEAHRKK